MRWHGMRDGTDFDESAKNAAAANHDAHLAPNPDVIWPCMRSIGRMPCDRCVTGHAEPWARRRT